MVLMDYDKQKTLRFLCFEKFAVNLMMHRLIMITTMMMTNRGHGFDGRVDLTAIVMMCACAVGGLHLPLAKDYLIIRVSQSTFIFVMSDPLYNLQFPPMCKPHLIDTLVRVFIKFGHYITTPKIVFYDTFYNIFFENVVKYNYLQLTLNVHHKYVFIIFFMIYFKSML